MIRKEFGRILRGAAIGALAIALVTGTAACGSKDETAVQADTAGESAQAEQKAEEPINPEEVREEAKEEILEETNEQQAEVSGEEVKEEVKEEPAEEKKEETDGENNKENTVIEKPGPSDENTASGQDAEEVKKEEKEEEKEESGAKGLALLDGHMTFDGMELQFPVELSGMTLGDWKLEYVNVDDPGARTLAPQEVVTAVMTSSAFSSDDVKVTAEFGNYSDSEAALSDIPMTGIYIERGKGKDGNDPNLPKVEMPGGLTWGSSEQEVRDLFGEASLSGTFCDRDFDFKYENGEYMVEFGGMNDSGLDYIVYCCE